VAGRAGGTWGTPRADRLSLRSTPRVGPLRRLRLAGVCRRLGRSAAGSSSPRSQQARWLLRSHCRSSRWQRRRRRHGRQQSSLCHQCSWWGGHLHLCPERAWSRCLRRGCRRRVQRPGRRHRQCRTKTARLLLSPRAAVRPRSGGGIPRATCLQPTLAESRRTAAVAGGWRGLSTVRPGQRRLSLVAQPVPSPSPVPVPGPRCQRLSTASAGLQGVHLEEQV